MASSQSQIREVPMEGKLGNVSCKCGEGWTCEITKTSAPDAGKPNFKCGENCNCSIEGVKEIVGEGGSRAKCECGEGWSCVVSRVDPFDAQKGFECSGPCTCDVVA
ncbi:uncharacterized protein LOC129284510 [Prosopis cineraria]|uniref:uncharacterized protein LOC129284510 n=1 Tax=Prosopis cineraria TaxID=364024 RepID=UPI00240FEAFC|nr:uncharacterized protein LOC129284510 [Prosopis cineraria]